MEKEQARYELAYSILGRSTVACRAARAILEGKAKTALAGAIILGIVMGGLGAVAGLSGEASG